MPSPRAEPCRSQQCLRRLGTRVGKEKKNDFDTEDSQFFLERSMVFKVTRKESSNVVICVSDFIMQDGAELLGLIQCF